jgi:hypothetical protein
LYLSATAVIGPIVGLVTQLRIIRLKNAKLQQQLAEVNGHLLSEREVHLMTRCCMQWDPCAVWMMGLRGDESYEGH